MKEMNDLELAWVIGYLEGEGSFYLVHGMPGRARVAVATTDWDVVYRLKKTVGMGCINGPYTPAASNRKCYWQWTLYGREAKYLLETLEYHMGERRQEQIRKCLYSDS